MSPPETAFAPDAFPESQFYLDAFSVLTTERQLGAMGGAGYIPWSKAIAYAVRVGLASEDEQDRFWRFIHGSLDDEYLKWIAEKQKTDSESLTT